MSYIGCVKHREFISVESDLILARFHLFKEMYGLGDEEEDIEMAKIMLIRDCGELIREIYCICACQVSVYCDYALEHYYPLSINVMPRFQVIEKCPHSTKINKVVRSLIFKHLPVHKYIHHYVDQQDGLADFWEKFGWLFLKIFCGFTCDYRYQCVSAKQYLPTRKECNSETTSVYA